MHIYKRKSIYAHDRGKSYREEQDGGRGMTASLFTKVDSENALLTLTKKFPHNFLYVRITMNLLTTILIHT